METWILKVKISVLWLFYSVGCLAVMALAFMEPGAIEQIMAGEISFYGWKNLLLILTILLLVPLIMAFLSLTLKDSANRWTNIILGIVFTVFQLTALMTLAQPSAHMILLEGAKVVAAALIVWYAWKWPKQGHK